MTTFEALTSPALLLALAAYTVVSLLVEWLGSTVKSKNLSFTQRLAKCIPWISGHFLNRCGIKSSPKAPTFGVLCAAMDPRIQVRNSAPQITVDRT